MQQHEIPNNEADILRVALDIANHRDVLRHLLSRAHMEVDSLKEQYRISQAAASAALQACDEASERANAADGGMNQLLIERANTIEAQAASIRVLKENIDSLNCLIEYSRLEVLEANRLRIAAFERNAELEKQVKAFTETPYSVRLEKQTRDAMTALRDVIRELESDPGLAQALERIVVDLGAPTLPRRDATPGLEVSV